MKQTSFMLGRRILTHAAMLGAGLAFCLNALAAETKESAGPAKTRIGTYESRAVGLAYGRSKVLNDRITALRAEAEKARQAGDEKRLAEFKKAGAASQDRLHRQVFGDAPIDDIMEIIKDALPAIQKQANVSKIVREAKAGPTVEIVDVTPLLVAHFNPTKETLKMIEEIKKHPPLKASEFPIKD
jgi:hypothetical protein